MIVDTSSELVVVGDSSLAKQTESKAWHSGQFSKGNKRGHRFKPGESGNPLGRPRRGEALGMIIRTWLDQRDRRDKAKRARIVTLVERLYYEDPRLLLAYGFGKPVEQVELTGANGQPVEFRIAVQGDELP